jgi:hypothetical protein
VEFWLNRASRVGEALLIGMLDQGQGSGKGSWMPLLAVTVWDRRTSLYAVGDRPGDDLANLNCERFPEKKWNVQRACTLYYSRRTGAIT